MKASIERYLLEFKRPAGTSRGVLNTKETFILKINEDDEVGVGECAIFRGLSSDDVPDYEEKLNWLIDNINEDKNLIEKELKNYPSILFGYEQAILNLENRGNIYFPSEFTKGQASMKINGLIWMGSVEFMQEQIQEKLANGFSCIKLKIGTDWNSERAILKEIRKKFPADKIELRVDANGGFSFEEAPKVLQELADLEIHSIEQPIKAGNRNQMSELCKSTPFPIALDEELIGVNDFEGKKRLLEEIKPQYIILKPALVGGFKGSDEWIRLAENLGIGWWITSALESNIGLNAIAQYTFTKNSKMPQGLGTGSLFTNNFKSSLDLKGENLYFKI